MQIDPKKCVACGNCIAVCPIGAISIDPKTNLATISYEECVECGTCARGMSQEHLNPVLLRCIRGLLRMLRLRFEPEPDVCPTASFVMEELPWLRVIRQVFSGPLIQHKSTGIHGRGTEEVKTNDVSGRVSLGEAGYVIEFGRPGVGVRFHDIQTMTIALAEIGICFESNNPVTHLMTDQTSGTLRDDILSQKILSAIVEIKTPISSVAEVLDTVDRLSEQLDTVVAVGVSTRCNDAGEDTALSPLLEQTAYTFYRAKTNMGLGRITNLGRNEGRDL